MKGDIVIEIPVIIQFGEIKGLLIAILSVNSAMLLLMLIWFIIYVRRENK